MKVKRKTWSLALALCFLLTLFPIPARATIVASGGCGAENEQDIAWTLDSRGLLSLTGHGAMKDYQAYNNPWEFHSRDITSVSISPGITAIGSAAFHNCYNLTGVTIPESVAAIHSSAFNNCDKLTNIDVESGNEQYSSIDGILFDKNKSALIRYPCGKTETAYAVPDTVSTIGASAFNTCKYLESVTIPGNVSAIGSGAFVYCLGLKSLVISDGVSVIGNSAFYSCNKLESVTIPDSVSEIGSFAFYSCESLTSVKLPAGLSVISEGLFESCKSLLSIEIPDSVTEIQASAFKDCSSLIGVTVPDSVTRLEGYLFEGCSSLISARLPDGISVLLNNVFSGCSSLTNVNIPESVTDMHYSVFYGCSSLKSLTIPENTAFIMRGVFGKCDNLTLRVYDGSYGHKYCQQYELPCIVLPPNAKSVEISPTAVALEIGETVQLTATVTPENASNKTVWWQSINPTIASVDENGLVSANAPGQAQIMVVTEYGGFSAFCAVTVNAPVAVSGVALSQSALTLDVGASETLTAVVFPQNAANLNITWRSSDESVATVDENGTVTMVAPGAAVVTVTTEDGGKTASCTVTTPVNPTGLKLDKTTLILSVGMTAPLSASVFPGNATNRVVRWASSSPDIASVGANGMVTALKDGSATIVAACAVGGAYAVCLVTVQSNVTRVTGVSVTPSKVENLGIGNSVTLSAAISPANASNLAVTWTSDRPEVAAVSAKGTVTARSAGSAVITATTADGDKTASCTVTVPASERTPDSVEANLSGAVEIIKGSPLNVPGLTVYAVYGAEKEAVKNYVLSGYDAEKTGTQNITVTYREKTASFQVTVVDRAVVALSVVQPPAKREYAAGEALSLSGLTLRADYNDKTSQEITDTSGLSVSGFDSSKAGSCTVTVSYGGKSADFAVAVREASAAVPAPSLNIVSFAGGKRVELSSAQNAQIRYTTDGSDPLSGGATYAGPLEFTETKTVKAVALLDGNASSVTTGRVSVPRAETPAADYASGAQLPAGTLVTLRTETQGANIYYTTNGDEPSVKSALYGSGVPLNADATIKAIAVKEGCSNSDILTLTYSVPSFVEEERSGAVISFGSVTSRAGEAVSVPVYIFADQSVTEFRFTVKYDTGAAGRVFDYASVSPVAEMRKSSLLVSDDAASGELTVYYQGVGIEGGEMFALNLNVLASAEDGVYPLTLCGEGINVKTESATPLLDVMEGAITLEGSHNSQLTGSVTFSGGGAESDQWSALPSGASKVSATFAMEPYQPEQSASVTVNVFAAVYDRDGLMVDLEMWETFLSNAESVFLRDIDIPPNVQVGRIKIMILSDDLTPLIAQSAL